MTDTYSIKFTSDGEPSGKTAISVAPTAVDNSTSIPIHGKYSTPFGEDLWTSILHVMENFCSATGPSSTKVTMGQLWFDSGTQTLKIWRVLSVSPYTVGWAPVNSFDSSGTLSVALKTSVVDNGILDDTATYDGYFTTKAYSDAHYLPRGNYVSGTTALSKAKIKYSTDVTFETSDSTALVTKKYVDDKIGVVGTLSFTVAADGSMTATKALIGSPNNLILNETPAFDDYFVTRDYADDRYFLVGTFDNSVRRQSRSKIKYSSDITYASNTDDDYTLVHKKYVADAITAGNVPTPAWLNVTTQPSLGVLWSDGTNPISNIPITSTNTSGQVLAINSSKTGFEWITPPTPNNLPSWLSTTPTGVLIGNGTTVSGLSSTVDKRILATKVTGTTTTYEWSALSDVGAVGIPSDAGFLYSNGTAISSSKGGNDTVLSINSIGAPEWIAKASLGGSGSGPTATKLSVYGTKISVPNTVATEPTTPSQTITLTIPANSTAIDYEIRLGCYTTGPNVPATGISTARARIIVKANGVKVFEAYDSISASLKDPGDSVHDFKFSAPASAAQTLTVEMYAYVWTLQGMTTYGFDIQQWLIADPLSATVTISGGSGGGAAVPATGVVTSNGTALVSKSYGTNGYLLASDNATGLKWVDPSTLSGGGNSLSGAINAMAAHDTSTKTLPSTQSVEKTGSQQLFHDGSNSSYTLSAPTSLLTLTIPAITVDTPVCITVGYKTAFTGSSPICLHYMYVEINGALIRKVSSSETFMTTLRAGTSYTLTLVGQYSCALGGLSTAVATVSDMFIEVLAVGGTLTGTGGSSSGAVKMVKNTVATKTNTTLSNIVSITIPASPDGTSVEYWITGGTGSASTTPQTWSIATLTIKNGTAVITEGNINSSGSGWSGAGSVTVSTAPVTIIMAGTGAGSITYRNNYLTATPISPL